MENNKETQKSIQYNKTVLDNGITVLTEEIPTVESFSLGINFKIGSRDDLSTYDGLAHFVEHTVFRRTKHRTSRQISNETESVGAYSNAFTTKEFTSFYIRALKEHFAHCSDILCDVVFNPVFNPKDVEKERKVILEEVNLYKDEAEELIFDASDAILFENSTLAHPIIGCEESVNLVNSDVLHDFHKNYLNPEKVIISVVGNIKHNQIVDVLAKNMSRNKFNKSEIPRQLTSKPTSLSIVKEKKPFHQTHFIACRRVEDIFSKERFPISALNILLGDGLSSRLNQAVREKNGLAYSIYSQLNLLSDGGAFYIYAGTEKQSGQKLKRVVFEEMTKIIDNKKITQKEFLRVKEQLKSSTIISFESLSTRMQTLAKTEFLFKKYEPVNEIITKINEIKFEDVQSLAEKYLDTADWNTITFVPEERG